MQDSVLRLLREADGFISGEEMAGRLGVSRTAVWKHIQELRRLGYEIVSHSRSGYSLVEAPDRLLAGEIASGLGTRLIGADGHIVSFEEIDSTNLEAKRRAAKGDVPDGTVFTAERQTGGRGRLSRSFFSPYGKGIWFSVLLKPPFAPQEAPKCTLMAAVAVAEALEKFGLTAGIKWPNDILFEGKKLVGILTEMSSDIDTIKYIVIGIGINVNLLPEDFPEELRASATSLQVMNGGKPLQRVELLQALLRSLEELYELAVREGFAPVMERWRAHSLTIGQRVRVIGARGEEFTGLATGIDDYGALLVESEGAVRRVLAGDVSIRPTES